MTYRWMLPVALAAALLVMPRYVESCGPFPVTLLFTTYHNTLPGAFASGHPGVIRPHFERRDLLLAYREFSGAPVQSSQPQSQPAPAPAAQAGNPWASARSLVPNAPAAKPVDTEKKVPGEDYESYTNCLDDAFATAAATLRSRVAQWGAASPQIAEWLRGQDQVFQNCSAGPDIPQPLPSADKLLADDRAYQIAAAEMYAEQYAKAVADFDRIAATADSPWRATARYVAARVCIRQGTLGKDPAKLREAAGRLETIVKDSGAGDWRARAEALLGFVRARTEPQQQLIALGEQLMRPTPRPNSNASSRTTPPSGITSIPNSRPRPAT